MSDKTAPPVPDLRALLAEASRPSASCTVPLKQGHRTRIAELEAELEAIATDAPSKRMGSESPLKVKAREIEALRDEMRASSLTFVFEAMSSTERDSIRDAMGGRDDPDEINLRAIAAMCRRVSTADGVAFPDAMSWTDFRDLRDRIGVRIFEDTVDQCRDGGVRWRLVCPFLVKCLADPRNREVAQEVATATEMGLPLAVARGVRLSGWSPRDWALAQASKLLDWSRCPGCGQPRWLAHDKSSSWRPQMVKCESCNAIEDLKETPQA